MNRLVGYGTFVKKTSRYVYEHGLHQRDRVGTVENMVDAMRLARQAWERGEKDAIGSMLATWGDNQSPAFWKLCQAIAECLPEGNKEKQWLEGMLMSKDQYQAVDAVGTPDRLGGQTELDL